MHLMSEQPDISVEPYVQDGAIAISGLDETDIAITQRLQVNGRASFRSIARELGLAEGTVRNRVHRLLDEKLIQIVAIPNALASGRIIVTVVSLKVSREPEAVAAEMVDWPEVPWITICSDEILASVYSDGLESLRETLRRIHQLGGVYDVNSYVCLEGLKHTYVRHVRSPGADGAL
jgi:Lrp/AsnC family transcriptional regulator for asnA, asnC and gidA